MYTAKGKNHHQFKHGMGSVSKRDPLYQKWSGMKRRCQNKNDKAYPRYGGSGITVSKPWQDFQVFYKDMSPTYFLGATIDRIDGTKGYSKENCRWVTLLDQARNKKSVVLYEYKGKTKTIPEWAQEFGIKEDTLFARIKRYGWSVEEALTVKTSYGNKYRNNKTKD